VKSSDGSNDMGHTSTVKSIYRPCKLNKFNFSIRDFKYHKRFRSVASSLSVITWYSSSFSMLLTSPLISLKFHLVFFYIRVNTFFRALDIIINTIYLYNWSLKRMKVFFNAMHWISETALLFGRFPGFDNFSFWYGALSEWYWLRDKPDIVLICPSQISYVWPGIEPGLPWWQDLSKLYAMVGS